MDAVNWRGLIRFSIALIGEILLCASLNLFDDWTLEEMPEKFVVAGLLCGLAYFMAVRSFPAQLSARAQRGIFWAAVIALRLVALPLEPGDDFWRYQWEGKIQHAGFNPYVNAPDDPALDRSAPSSRRGIRSTIAISARSILPAPSCFFRE